MNFAIVAYFCDSMEIDRWWSDRSHSKVTFFRRNYILPSLLTIYTNTGAFDRRTIHAMDEAFFFFFTFSSIQFSSEFIFFTFNFASIRFALPRFVFFVRSHEIFKFFSRSIFHSIFFLHHSFIEIHCFRILHFRLHILKTGRNDWIKNCFNFHW